MNILIEILILSIFCNGIYIAAEDGMIFSKPNRWLENKLPIWLYKPLIGCIYCMASFWGVVVHFIYSGCNNLHLIPVIIICGCFMNGFIRTIYDLIYNKAYTPEHKIFDFNQQIEQHEGKDN